MVSPLAGLEEQCRAEAPPRRLLEGGTVPMTAHRIARGFLAETQNARNLDVVDELVSPGFVRHSEVITGIDALKSATQTNLDAFPDCQVTLDEQISSDDTVVTRSSGRGAQQGEFHGLEPTGKRGHRYHRLDLPLHE